MGGFSQEGLQRTDHFNTDAEGLALEISFTGPTTPSEETNTAQVFKKGADTKRDITETERDDTEVPDEKRHKLKMDTDTGSDLDELAAVGSQMEECIEEVQLLEKRRKELLETEEQIDSKVLELMDVLKMEKEGRREERKKEMAILKEEKAEEERRTWKVNLERQGLQTSNTQDELTECRRHSCGDIEQYVQGGLKSLEDRYEPILLALLKRREAAEASLAKAKEQAQELRAQLTPLREEMQKLQLQRACLEEKLKLIHMQRREDVGQYKETVYYLEESSRELRTELQIQKKKTQEIAELKDSLSKQLQLYSVHLAILKSSSKSSGEFKVH
uniref:Syncoilin, intermediate filament protein n=1 Tax=Salarias fasciatus TaxID=181472 RepID=A0A672GV02_SALFA